MTGNKHKTPPIPTLYRSSPAYGLKASYQRNLLVGLLCAAFLVVIPAVGHVEKVPVESCGRSCESMSVDSCDLPPLCTKYLRVRTQFRLR